jgi:hypothetical protein
MRKATLTREISSDEGTFGTLVTDLGFTCRTGELPSRENAHDRSCIPAGVYRVTFRMSSKHGLCYHVENVPGRTGIEIHAANFMGDRDKGYVSDLLGCIAPGREVRKVGRQAELFFSRDTLHALEKNLGCQEFELTILAIPRVGDTAPRTDNG